MPNTDDDLQKEIFSLETLVSTQEENYKTALLMKVPFDTLKQMRENIRKLKSDLQILLDKQSVQNTGELPKE